MIDVFIAYAHNDLGLKNELKKFLAPLLREKRVSVWDDFDIEAGDDWDAAIKQRLYAADLVLLLVSADSLASDYFYGKEVQVSLERHQRGEAVVVPVILRHCDWESTPLGDLEALPEKGRPVVKWPTHDEAFSDVVRRLRAVVGNLEAKHKAEGEQAEARRQFAAAVEAAEHLFQKEDWAEAVRAYAAAAGLHRAGFVPEKTVLEQQQAACHSNAKSAEAAQKAAREATEREQRAATERAQQQEMEFEWVRAYSSNSPEVYEHFATTFPNSPHAKEARQKAKELRRLFEKTDAWQNPTHPPYNPPAKPNAGFPWKPIAAVAVGALVVTFLLWRPGKRNEPNNQPEQQPTRTETPSPQPPANTGVDKEQQKKRVESLLKEGRAFRNLDEPARAKAKFNEVLSLDPGNAEAQKNLRELK